MTLDLLLRDYTLQIVALGSAVLGAVSGILGSFAVLRKQSLLGDAVSHAALPGIAFVFLITGVKQTEMLLLGALISGLLGTFMIVSVDRYTRIKFDSALGLILSSFFGLGLVLLTYIQKIPNANQAGLENFIFGQASTLLKRDVYWMIGLGIMILIVVIVFWKELKIFSFDPEFGKSIGFSDMKINILLSSITVIAIIIGLQSVGVILMSALLIAPGVAARQWTDKLSIMVLLAAIFGIVAGVTGTIISSLVGNMPTGPVIVVVISLIVFFSLFFATKRGMLWRVMRMKRNRRDINDSKVLVNLYELAMNHDVVYHAHKTNVIMLGKNNKRTDNKHVIKSLLYLCDKGYVRRDYFDTWSITDSGIEKAKRIMANHGGEKL